MIARFLFHRDIKKKWVEIQVRAKKCFLPTIHDSIIAIFVGIVRVLICSEIKKKGEMQKVGSKKKGNFLHKIFGCAC